MGVLSGIGRGLRRVLEFLVRNHLLMSTLAQTRDIDDMGLVNEFVREVGTEQSLIRYEASAGGRFTRFAGRDWFSGGFLRHLYVDGAGRLWIATSERSIPLAFRAV